MKFRVEVSVADRVNELMNLADSMASGCASMGTGVQNYDLFIHSREELKTKLKEFLEA